MKNRLISLGGILISLVLVTTACSAAQVLTPTPSNALSPSLVASPTAAPVASDPTSAAATSLPETGATQSPSVVSGQIQYVFVPGKSEARYRVREQLANVSFPSDAIGKTQDVSGMLTIQPDGTIVSSQSKIVVDISNLTSDRSMRDRFVSGRILNTSQYPQVTFVPTQVTGLSSPLPQTGQVSFKLTGDLTIKDVTKPVTWDVTLNVQGNEIKGQATTSFKFEDFNIQQPQVPVVLSVVDNITLELDLDMQRSGS